jgi:hypothetical protein
MLSRPRRDCAFWYEAKASGGTLSGAQQRFADLCAECAVGYVVGGVADVRDYLEAAGILEKSAPSGQRMP